MNSLVFNQFIQRFRHFKHEEPVKFTYLDFFPFWFTGWTFFFAILRKFFTIPSFLASTICGNWLKNEPDRKYYSKSFVSLRWIRTQFKYSRSKDGEDKSNCSPDLKKWYLWVFTLQGWPFFSRLFGMPLTALSSESSQLFN